MAWGDNSRIIQTYNDNSYYTFSDGNKDSWHLQYNDKNGQHDLYDKDYLTRISKVAQTYGKKETYEFFNFVYNLVSINALNNHEQPQVQKTDLNKISNYSKYFKNNQLMIHKLFDCFYLTMISEWYYINPYTKKNSILKHKVKRLGVYQVLFKGMNPIDAANFSKGKSVKELSVTMDQYQINFI